MSFSFALGGQTFSNLNVYQDSQLPLSIFSYDIFRRRGLPYPGSTNALLTSSTAYSAFSTPIHVTLRECPSDIDLILGLDFANSCSQANCDSVLHHVPTTMFTLGDQPPILPDFTSLPPVSVTAHKSSSVPVSHSSTPFDRALSPTGVSRSQAADHTAAASEAAPFSSPSSSNLTTSVVEFPSSRSLIQSKLSRLRHYATLHGFSSTFLTTVPQYRSALIRHIISGDCHLSLNRPNADACQAFSKDFHSQEDVSCFSIDLLTSANAKVFNIDKLRYVLEGLRIQQDISRKNPRRQMMNALKRFIFIPAPVSIDALFKKYATLSKLTLKL
ncbi:hypothetical protein BDP27DRAFT_1431005 [Rhodocollybia butyracea]|uniref:Uncharacterized protein n=1 Tax=Rhodocollybia butyracea TaxID=206335 RepID=A0A9P5PA03_9AGAR|nr:hypothetical protein BDP27DRAFT_1431005 [Rhodocollybia butyracea]